MPLPTNRATGDTIQAADLNDIAAAVNTVTDDVANLPAPVIAGVINEGDTPPAPGIYVVRPA